MATASVDVLARVPLFAGLEKRELERIAKEMRERRFSEGDVVVREGDEGAGFFVIIEGSGTITVGGELRASVGPGDFFGEMALVDQHPRSATVVAATDMTCLALTAWEFRPIVEKHPSVAWKLLGNLAERLRALERGGQVS